MVISYRPLWIQLADKGLQKTDAIKKNNKNLEKICVALSCCPNYVFEFVEEGSEE